MASRAGEANSPDTRNPAGAAARRTLIEVAERLFGEQGIEAVSVRSILRAAGQRNGSAIHYYFGSKDSLVVAILEERLPVVNARRDRALDELLAREQEPTLRDLVAVRVRPFAEILRMPWGPDYMKFVGRLLMWPHTVNFDRVVHERSTAGERIEQLIRARLADLPQELLDMRMDMLRALLFDTMAMWARRMGSISDLDWYIEDFIDVATAGIEVPAPDRDASP